MLTKIVANYKTESVTVQNYTSDVIDCAFGKKENPSWEDYLRFLESRCFPRNVCNLNLHLEELGLNSYVPLDIIRKTQGRLYGNPYSLIIEEYPKMLQDFEREVP